MNQLFDMRLDVKPSAKPAPAKKPAASKQDSKPAESDFNKALKDKSEGMTTKQPTPAQKEEPVNETVQTAQTAKSNEEQGVLNAQQMQAAAMIAAAMLPTIVVPEEQTDLQTGEMPVLAGTEGLMEAMPVMDETFNAMPVQTAENTVLTDARPQIETEQPEIFTEQFAKPQVQTEQTEAVTAQKMESVDTPVVQQVQDEDAQKAEVLESAVQPERPLFDRVESGMVKVAEPVPADTPEFPAHLSERIDSAMAQGQDTIEVQLTPEHLGKITIRLSATQEGTLITLHTASSKTASLLSEHAANIGAIVEHNRPGPVSVHVEQEQHDAQNYQHQNGGDQSQNQQDGSRNNHARNRQAQQDDFIQQLRLGLAGMMAQD